MITRWAGALMLPAGIETPLETLIAPSGSAPLDAPFEQRARLCAVGVPEFEFASVLPGAVVVVPGSVSVVSVVVVAGTVTPGMVVPGTVVPGTVISGVVVPGMVSPGTVTGGIVTEGI